MSNEVDYILERLESVEAAQPFDHPLWRINRDESYNVTEDRRRRKEQLTNANIVGVSRGDSSSEVRGNEYNLDTQVPVSVRIEGLHYLEYGHIDPDGMDGVVFDDLVTDIRSRIMDDRTHPGVGGPDAYKHILPPSSAPDLSLHRDHYRTELTFTFEKIETL